MRLLLALLATATLAVATPGQEHRPMDETSCWDCHGPGLWNPPMTQPIATGITFTPDGTRWNASLDLHNDWLHEVEVGAVVRGVELAPLASPTPGDMEVTGIIPAGGAGTTEFRFAPLRAAAMTLAFSMTEATNVPVSVEVRPASGLRAWIPLDGPLVLGIEDMAAVGQTEWEGRITTERAHSGIQWTLDITPQEVTGAIIARSAPIPAGHTGTVTFPVSIQAGDAVGRLTFDLFTTTFYEHDQGVDDNEGWLRSSADFRVDIMDGVPGEVQDLDRPPAEGAPGLGLLPMLAVVGIIARRR